MTQPIAITTARRCRSPGPTAGTVGRETEVAALGCRSSRAAPGRDTLQAARRTAAERSRRPKIAHSMPSAVPAHAEMRSTGEGVTEAKRPRPTTALPRRSRHEATTLGEVARATAAGTRAPRFGPTGFTSRLPHATLDSIGRAGLFLRSYFFVRARRIVAPGPGRFSISSGRSDLVPFGTIAATTGFLSIFRRCRRGGFSLR